jgi:soluble lytic murein transglycosylase-like protein
MMANADSGSDRRQGQRGIARVVTGRTVLSFVACLCLMAIAADARAEIVFFHGGRTMSVKSHHTDGESLVLTLRSGGEIICEPSLVARIGADEVPYPEPEPVVTEQPAIAVAEAAVSVPYGDIIDRMSAEQSVSAKLVRAVIQVESAYNSRARSPKGAMGLMQLMPATARQYAVADPYDPASNIEAGIKHLKSLLQRLPVSLALAAYNAGEAAVQRFNGIPPYPETRNYVSRIMRLAAR